MNLILPFTLPFMARALAELLVLGARAGTVGVLILLRRLAFMTDALTHTVFPGVVIGYLCTGEGGVFWGALAAGLLTAVLLTLLPRHRAVTEDTALAVLAALALLRRPLLARTFDPQGAQAAGHRIGLLDLATNAIVALVVVASVRAVGTVLVLALLIVPAAAARAVSDRRVVIVPVAALLGAGAGWAGLAISYDASVHHGVRLASGGTVVLVLIGLYLAALAFAAAGRRLRAG